VSPQLACPGRSMHVSDPVEAAMRSVQHRCAFGLIGLKASLDAFRQRAVHGRVAGREPFREVIRDALNATGMAIKRDTLADTLYDFLAARSPDSVTMPGVDISGYAMALLVLTGAECTHYRAEVAFHAIDTDRDEIVAHKDVEAFLRGFPVAAASLLGGLMARVDLVFGRQGDKCDQGMDVAHVRICGRYLIEAAARPTALEVAYFANLICPGGIPAASQNLTPRVEYTAPSATQPTGASQAHSSGIPQLPLAQISAHPEGVWVAEAQVKMPTATGPVEFTPATITPRGGGAALVEDAPRWEGRAVDSLAEVAARMQALSSALSRESSSRQDGYRREADFHNKAVACRWAEDQVLRNRGGDEARERTRANIQTAAELHKSGVRLSLSTVESGRTGDHAGRYGQQRAMHAPYRPALSSSSAGRLPQASTSPGSASGSVNSFFSRRYPSGYDSINRTE